MNTKIVIAIVSIILLGGLCAVLWSLTSVQTPQQETATQTSGSAQSPYTPPSTSISVDAVTTIPGSMATTSSEMIAVRALNGGTVTTLDFIHNGVTIPDAANNGSYLLAGDLGYCVTNVEECRAGPTTDFNIFYDATYKTFTIALLKEPLGQIRLEVEQYLMKALGISQSEMCRLDYYIGTTSYINPLYSSKNLGFSFCPGATLLPK